METQLATRRPTYLEPFCTCLERNWTPLDCNCGEEYAIHDWTWDENDLKHCTLSNNKRDMVFDGGFTSGTIRGELPFQPNRHYYWEIKILNEQYTNDIDFGVGAKRGRINTRHSRFRVDWGYSYRRGAPESYTFFRGSIVGMHLDMCNGTLEFYNNRRPLGVAYTGLKGMQLYPVVDVYSHRPGEMRLTCALSMTPSLKLLSMLTLRKNKKLASSLDQVPGLRYMLASRFWWLMGPEQSQQHEDVHPIVASPPSSHETGPSSSAESSSSDSEYYY